MGSVRLKLGDAEIEISSDDMPVDEAIKIASDALHREIGRSPNLVEKTEPRAAHVGSSNAAHISDVSVNSVVAVLGGDSCREILVAAAAVLGVCQGRARFPKQDWLKLAASASAWKAGYAPNQARDIKRLVKSGDIIENAKDTYSMSKSLQESIEEKLAGKLSI